MSCFDRGVRSHARGLLGPSLALLVALASTSALADPTNPGEIDNPLVQPEECSYCHSFANQASLASEPPYSPQIGWTPTMMANAARDPVFWAAVALASQDDPGGETEDCIRCHSPNAFLEGRAGAIAIDELEEADLHGVSCEVCHRMTSGGEIGNAQYEIDDDLIGASVGRRGPWDYTDGVPAPVPGVEQHAAIFDSFTGSSQLCGTCHDVTTHRERVDDQGVGMGMDFNEQRTYSEWANSAFAVEGEDFRSCQQCHMPEIPDSAGCGPYNNQYQHPQGNRRHDLLGANRFMLTLLAEDAPPGFVSTTYDFALDVLDEFVQTSATMEVVGPDSVDLNEGLAGVQVTVTNETGHKLPSGYSEGRVMWIEVVARYGDDVVYSSGQWDQEAGTIQDDELVRRYEGIAEQLDSGTRNHLLLNDHWVVDSRIPPRGLTPNVQTDPVGDRYGMTPEGAWEHWDEAAYDFGAAEGVVDGTPKDTTDDELDVSVRLLYLINTPDYIGQLADDNETNEVGTELAGRFDALGGATPVVLAEQSLSIPITGFPPVAGGSSSGDAGDSSSGNASDPTAPMSTSTDPTAATMTTPGGSDGSSSDTEPAAGGGGGGGCNVAGGQPAWAWSLLLLGFAARRRRTLTA